MALSILGISSRLFVYASLKGKIWLFMSPDLMQKGTKFRGDINPKRHLSIN